MAEAAVPPALLVACCGNPSAGDDALGTLVARALAAQRLPAEVEILDLGANPASLTDHLEGRAALIVVDAISLEHGAAGTLVDCGWPEAREALRCSASHVASTHGLGLTGQLRLAEQLGVLPPSVRVLGVTIARAGVWAAMSDAVRDCLPELVRRVRAAVDEIASAR